MELFLGIGGVHVAALAQLCLGGRINTGAEGIHPVKTGVPQGSHIVSEQGQNQGFLRMQHPQSAEGNPAEAQPDNGYRDAGARSTFTEKIMQIIYQTIKYLHYPVTFSHTIFQRSVVYFSKGLIIFLKYRV